MGGAGVDHKNSAIVYTIGMSIVNNCNPVRLKLKNAKQSDSLVPNNGGGTFITSKERVGKYSKNLRPKTNLVKSTGEFLNK